MPGEHGDGVAARDGLASVLAGDPRISMRPSAGARTARSSTCCVTIAPWQIDGRIAGVTGISIDITERKRVERAREQALADLEEAQRLARLGSWSWDPSTDEASWSAQMYEIFGRDPALGPATGEEAMSLRAPRRSRARRGCVRAHARRRSRVRARASDHRAATASQRTVRVIGSGGSDPQRLLRGHGPGHHRAAARRARTDRAARGERPRREREPRQERVPGADEPRATHAAELDRRFQPARRARRARRRASASTSATCSRPPATCSS